MDVDLFENISMEYFEASDGVVMGDISYCFSNIPLRTPHGMLFHQNIIRRQINMNIYHFEI